MVSRKLLTLFALTATIATPALGQDGSRRRPDNDRGNQEQQSARAPQRAGRERAVPRAARALPVQPSPQLRRDNGRYDRDYHNRRSNNGRYDMWVWKWEHDHSADELAEHARAYASEGMSIIGGCCGTRPEHIAAIAQAVGRS